MLSRPRAAAHSVFGRPEPHSRKNLPIDGSCQNAVPWKAIVLVFPSGETPASPFSVRIKKPDFGLPVPRNTHRALSIVSVARMKIAAIAILSSRTMYGTHHKKKYSVLCDLVMLLSPAALVCIPTVCGIQSFAYSLRFPDLEFPFWGSLRCSEAASGGYSMC